MNVTRGGWIGNGLVPRGELCLECLGDCSGVDWHRILHGDELAAGAYSTPRNA